MLGLTKKIFNAFKISLLQYATAGVEAGLALLKLLMLPLLKLLCLCALSMPVVGGCPIALWTQVSLYWLVLIKLQESVLLLMLPDPLLYNFWVTVVLAIVGQSLGLLQMLFEQVK